MADSDDIERTLCQLPQVHVFKIPPRKNAEGHRASDWPKDPSWSGKLRIVAKGKIAAIILLDDKNNVFAVCQVTDDAAVERTLDSGRYFVLRITNQQGRHAFIGIAFNERNDAFDFNVALSEFKNEIEREEKAAKMFSNFTATPSPDLSLKSGEKIKIKLNKKKTDNEDSDHPTHSVSLGGPLLAPPSRTTTNQPHHTSTAQTSDPFGSDPFGADPFGADPFAGSTDPFANSDPFATSSTAKTVDPFGFPVSKPTHPSASQNTTTNLLDF